MAEDISKTVLLIDDDEGLTRVLQDKLALEGYAVHVANSGGEGLTEALRTHPDLVLLDVMMPGMDGWHVLEALRKDPWGATANVIMLTNLSDMESISKAVDRGSFEYLVKTDMGLDEIAAKVKEALER